MTIASEQQLEQQLEVASEPEFDLIKTINWARKRVSNSNPRKTQLASLECSNRGSSPNKGSSPNFTSTIS